MSDRNGAMSPKDKQYLDMALDGQSDTFKVKVYEIIQRFRLDASDPAFLLLVATGRLEVLLDQFPEQFETVLNRELGRFQQQFQDIKQWMSDQKVDLKALIEGLKTVGTTFKSDLADGVTSLKELIEQQDLKNQALIESVTTLAQQERAELSKTNEQQLKVAQVQYLSAVKAQAETLIEQAGDKLRGRYVKQLILPISLAAIGLIGVGGLCGWTLHRQAMGELDPAGKRQLSLKQWESLQWAVSADGQLAKNLLDWNGSTIAECQNRQGPGGETTGMVTSDDKRPIKYGNCDLWIVSPDKREFGPKPSQ